MFERIVTNLKSVGKPRHEMLEDRPHIVVNTVMIMEGVWEGSGGKIFYPGGELRKSVPTWNHKPALIYHPEMEGKALSGCNPKIINKQKCGVVLEVEYAKGAKLKNETWFDEKRLKKLDEPTLAKIENGEQVEVSTGVIVDVDNKKGIWNSKKFLASAFNIVGDHLAILPKGVGACSVKDGAGLHQNQAVQIDKIMKFLIKNGVSHPFMINLNEMSHRQIDSALGMVIRAKLEATGNRWDGWIEEIFDNYAIFYADGGLFKISYKEKDGKVELTSEPSPVKRSVSYAPIKNELVSNSDKGDTEMADKKKAIVEGLIANGRFTEDDRETLLNWDEETLTKLQGLKAPSKPAPAATQVQSNNTQKKISYNEFLDMLDPEARGVIEEGVQMRNERKANLVETIMNADGNQFSKEWLELQPKEALEGMASLIPQKRQTHNSGPSILQRPATFQGAAGSAPVTNGAAKQPAMGRVAIVNRKPDKKTA